MNKKIVYITICLLIIVTLSIVGYVIYQSTKKQPQKTDTSNTSSQIKTTESANDPTKQNQPISDTTTPSQNKNFTDTSQEGLTQYIVNNTPSLVDQTTGLPNFKVVNTTNPLPNWYVVTLQNTSVDTSNANVVIKKENNILTTIAGPGTGLSLSHPNLPPEILQALREAPQ